jgi:hypothetical protein
VAVAKIAWSSALIVASLHLWAPARTQAQESRSATLAAELTRLLDDQKLDTIAAPQDGADLFVSALYIPGSQLLVVSARYSVPARIKLLLSKKEYREIYADLNSASEKQSKVFVMDLGANGLRPKREEGQLDTVDSATGSLVFDGDWDKAKLSEAEYRKLFEASDQQYSEMLQALIAALKKPS